MCRKESCRSGHLAGTAMWKGIGQLQVLPLARSESAEKAVAKNAIKLSQDRVGQDSNFACFCVKEPRNVGHSCLRIGVSRC